MKAAIITAALACLAAFPALAGSGSIVVKPWSATSSTISTSMAITNITNSTLRVSVDFYNRLGVKVTPTSAQITYSNFGNSNTTIAPRNTGSLKVINMGSDASGFAVIRWENIDANDDIYGLIASGNRTVDTGTLRSEVTIPVNDGMPF